MTEYYIEHSNYEGIESWGPFDSKEEATCINLLMQVARDPDYVDEWDPNDGDIMETLAEDDVRTERTTADVTARTDDWYKDGNYEFRPWKGLDEFE